MRLLVVIIVVFFVQTKFGFCQTFEARDTVGCDSLLTRFFPPKGVSATDFFWDLGNGETDTNASPTVFYDSVGLYTVQLIMDGTDTITREDYIFIRPTPGAGFFYSDSVTLGTYSVRFETPWRYDTIHYAYKWNFGDGNKPIIDSIPFVVHHYTEKGEYNVRLEIFDKAGCSDWVVRQISVRDEFKVPNVFTPNGDNKNDIFRVVSNGHTKLNISIFSPTGSLIFKKTAPVIIWDGYTTGGKQAPTGIYYYVIFSEDKVYEKQGYVYLFR